MSYFCSFPLFHDSESLSSVSIRVFSRARDLSFLRVETLTCYLLLYIYLPTSWGIHLCFDFRRSCLQESYWRTRFQRSFLSNTRAVSIIELFPLFIEFAGLENSCIVNDSRHEGASQSNKSVEH